MYKIILFFFISIKCFGLAVIPQDSIAIPKTVLYDEADLKPLEFDRQFIDELKQDSDFDYVREAPPENLWTQFKIWVQKQWNRFLQALFGDIEANSFFAFLIRLLPYIVLIAILGFVIWLFIKLDPGGALMKKAPQPNVFLTEDEKIIQSQDINKLIEKALGEQNYRLAVRYYYLLILKNLTEKNIINYEVDKTNEDYLKEINNLSWQEQFKLLTRIYDFIWYGNFAITENDFLKAEKQFKNMQTQLQQVSNE